MIPNVGDRIELIAMPDDPCPIEPGTTGTVTRVQELGWHRTTSHQVSVAWDVKRSLSLCIPPDVIKVIGHVEDASSIEADPMAAQRRGL